MEVLMIRKVRALYRFYRWAVLKKIEQFEYFEMLGN